LTVLVRFYQALALSAQEKSPHYHERPISATSSCNTYLQAQWLAQCRAEQCRLPQEVTSPQIRRGYYWRMLSSTVAKAAVKVNMDTATAA